MSDAALEEIMDWIVDRTEGAASLQWNGGWWTGEVWEIIDGRRQRNYPGGGPNPLAAAMSTFVRIASRTEPELGGEEMSAKLADWMQRHSLVGIEARSRGAG